MVRKFSDSVMMSGVFSNCFMYSRKVSYLCGRYWMFEYNSERVFFGMEKLSSVVSKIGCVMSFR